MLSHFHQASEICCSTVAQDRAGQEGFMVAESTIPSDVHSSSKVNAALTHRFIYY